MNAAEAQKTKELLGKFTGVVQIFSTPDDIHPLVPALIMGSEIFTEVVELGKVPVYANGHSILAAGLHALADGTDRVLENRKLVAVIESFEPGLPADLKEMGTGLRRLALEIMDQEAVMPLRYTNLNLPDKQCEWF